MLLFCALDDICRSLQLRKILLALGFQKLVVPDKLVNLLLQRTDIPLNCLESSFLLGFPYFAEVVEFLQGVNLLI